MACKPTKFACLGAVPAVGGFVVGGFLFDLAGQGVPGRGVCLIDRDGNTLKCATTATDGSFNIVLCPAPKRGVCFRALFAGDSAFCAATSVEFCVGPGAVPPMPPSGPVFGWGADDLEGPE